MMLRHLWDLIDFSGKKKLEKAFGGRASLTNEQFFDVYFYKRGYSKELVIKIKKIFNENIGFDLSRLSSEDDFSKELKFIWDYDSLADVSTVVGLEKAFDIKITDEEALKMKTMNDVVEIITHKLKGKGVERDAAPDRQP